MNFRQSIVADSIKYDDKNNKSKGYNVIKGNKKLDIGHLAILTGGRGNTLKKEIGLKEQQTCTRETNQSQWSSFACSSLEGKYRSRIIS